MNLFKAFTPPPTWRFPVIIITAVFFGLVLLVLYLSKAPAYLSDNPQTCVNCHIMSPQYATWNHSSHREVAHCNDCHVPHNNVFNKYFFKAKDGVRHATLFTLRLEPQVIHIKDAGKEVVQDNCIRCHENLLTDDAVKPLTIQAHQNREDRKCWECHRETPHGRVNSLTSVPNARVPLPESPVPNWLKNIMKKK